MVSYTIEDLKKYYENMTKKYIFCDETKDFLKYLEDVSEEFK